MLPASDGLPRDAQDPGDLAEAQTSPLPQPPSLNRVGESPSRCGLAEQHLEGIERAVCGASHLTAGCHSVVMLFSVTPKPPTAPTELPGRYEETIEIPSEERWAWLEIDLDQDFTAAFRIAATGDETTVVEVRVFPTRPIPEERAAAAPPRTRLLGTWTSAARSAIGVSVPTRVLRTVKVAEAASLAIKWATAAGSTVLIELGPMAAGVVPPRRARGPRDRQLLELVAALYQQARSDGSRSPARDVWEQMSRRRATTTNGPPYATSSPTPDEKVSYRQRQHAGDRSLDHPDRFPSSSGDMAGHASGSGRSRVGGRLADRGRHLLGGHVAPEDEPDDPDLVPARTAVAQLPSSCPDPAPTSITPVGDELRSRNCISTDVTSRAFVR